MTTNYQKYFGAKHLHVTTYLQNQNLTNVVLSNETPYQLWNRHIKPKFSNLYVFGC